MYLKHAILAAAIIIILISACDDPQKSDNGNYSIKSIYADGSPDNATTKLTIMLNENIENLSADDIKINANFDVLKGEIKKIKTAVYELEINAGKPGQIKTGLNPYNGFTGWSAKTADVYAVFHFNIIDEVPGTAYLTISGYELSGGTVTIPAEFTGVKVISIANSAFNKKQITGVEIPKSVTVIGNNAFSNNKLTSITIPKNTSIIGNNAFADNELSSVEIPDSVTIIGRYAFANNNLKTISIPESITTIALGAFMRNELESVSIPENIITIEDGAFAYNQIKSSISEPLVIPESVTAIGNSAFAFNSLESVVIGSNVKDIIHFAFWDNKLVSITIGEDVMLGAASFGEGFENAYNITNKKAAGTYTRENIYTTVWTILP